MTARCTTRRAAVDAQRRRPRVPAPSRPARRGRGSAAHRRERRSSTTRCTTTLCAWVDQHYRERLDPDDLADPKLARETMAGARRADASSSSSGACTTFSGSPARRRVILQSPSSRRTVAHRHVRPTCCLERDPRRLNWSPLVPSRFRPSALPVQSSPERRDLTGGLEGRKRRGLGDVSARPSSSRAATPP